MTNINSVFSDLAKYRRLAEEAEAVAKQLEAEIKAHMEAEGIDTLIGDEHKVTWKVEYQNRLDSTALKKALPDVAAQFMVQQERRPFRFA